jgi:amino acid adenylation domain-containing protein
VRLTYKQEVVPKAFAEELAQYFAVVADALLGSSEQPLSKISILQDALQAPLPSTGASEGRPQYWTDHLSRVERASTFPSTGRAHRVLKDTVRSANIAVLKPSDQAWTRTGLQASWALCLSRLTGNTQVLFGVAVEHSSGKKSDPRQATATLVPYAVQITKASTSQSLSEDVRSWVQDCQPYLSEGGDYIRASRGELGSAGQVDNVLIVCTEEPNAKAAFELISSEQRLLPASSHPDDWGCGLAMSCRIALNGSISVQASFDSLLMDTTRADLILRQYEHCIHQLFENLDTGKSLASLDPISDGERSLMRQWSSKSISTADICIHNEISQRATALPHSAAVNAWDGEISYTELDDLSSRLAVHLVEAGVQVGTFVPFYFAKSTAAVVAMIAVMKSGGVFVPLDIKHPEQRRAVILAELNSPIALCSSSWRTKLGDLGASVKTVIGTDMEHLRKLPASKQPAAVVGLENICYVTYTSGSTGKPKGIIVDHSNIATSVRSYRLRLGMDERTRTLQYVALTFDVSFSDIFMTLLSGGCLFIPTEEEHADAVGIVQAINRTSANWLCLTPSLATLLQPEDVPTTRTLVLIGEAMRTDLVEAWADRVALVNAYAPSEASIEASCRLVRRNDMKTDHNNIGSPNDCLYWVVDENNHEKLVPIGCPGELLIQGPNITRGYLHNPEKTEAAFIKRPEWMRDYVGEAAMHRLYKTGDIVEQHADSSVTYLGRSDSQFKLRGQRVDVMDIEHNVRQHLKDEWQTAVDVVHWDQDGRDPSLVCFLAKVPSTDKYSGAHALLGPEPELATSVRAGLSLAVPVYMIPDFYIPLRDLPTAPSGKTDRKALRSIASSIPPNMLGEYTGNSKPTPNVTNGATQKRSSQGSCSPPQAAKPTDKFAAMQRAWGRVLNTLPSSIQRHDNWFSSGGNSIKAMQLVAAARKEGLKLTVADIFNNPVLEDLELVASFRPTEMSSQSKPLLQTRNESFFPRICAHYPFLIPGNIESAAMATDTQAWMLATGEVTGSGFWNEIYIDSKDGLDVARLTQACAEVTRHHPLMRTVFVQLEEALYQVVLKDQHAVSKQNPGFSRDVGPQEEATRKHIPCFSYENLSSDDRLCHRLRLTIHHALYDGILLQMISKDIDSAYCGRPLTAGLPFHTWIAQIGARDFTATKAFWKKTLLASSMTHLHPPSGPCRHESQTGFLRTSVPIGTLQSSAGTEASVLKAAWAIVLARELCLDDVVFGQVVANRSSSFLETDQVMGPCVNLLPVRVPLTQKKNFSQVVQEVHEQHRASVPHQDLGFRQVIRDCTAWPQWTRFGSCVVYQNFGSMIRESEGSKFHIGDVEVAWCGDAQPADSGEIWVIAQPEPDNHAVVIEIRYIPGIISTEQAERLARNLATVLETGRLDPPTISPTWSLVGGDSDGEISNPTSPGSPPSRQSQELVTKAWRETKLFRDDVLPQADVSMFDCDADIVSALLLSRFFQRHGCDFGVAEVVRNPTQRSQATWLGSPDTTSEPFAPEYTVRAVGTPAPAPTTRYDLSDVDLTQQDGYVANYAIFPLEQRSEIASIGAALETGLSETLAQVPLLAGRVLRDSAKRSYVLCRPQDTCELALRYLNDSFPSYEKLESTHFPPSMLPRALLLPLSMPSTTSIYEHEWGEEGVPCLFLQASFLKGGMILATAWHHQVSDARGVDIFLGLLAENTRAALGGHTPRPRTAYELNIDRTPFVAVGKGESEDEEIDHSGLPHQLGSLARQDPSRLADIAASGRRMGEVVSMLLHIPEEQAAALKKICTPAEPKDEFDFVSTYQCVATLLHRLIVRARLRTGCMQPNDATATIHAINMRGRAREVPPTYFGNAVAASLMTPMTASELVGEAGLQKGTLNSRHDIRSVSMHHIRRYAHAYATHGAATVMQAMAALMTTGTVVTSWQQMRLAAYDLGFGPPHAFRSPNFGVNGQVIIYPTLPGQGVVASITSRKGCISAMQEDSEFIRYAEVWDVDKVSK